MPDEEPPSPGTEPILDTCDAFDAFKFPKAFFLVAEIRGWMLVQRVHSLKE